MIMKKYMTEALGTFFLVLTIGLTVSTWNQFAPLIIWSVLMVMVYAGGHISGAHYNPAITLGAVITKKMMRSRAWWYMLAQVIGAFLASWVSYILVGQNLSVMPSSWAGIAILAEVIFTFALVYTVLNVAMTKSTEWNSYFGLAIGFIVMVGVASVSNLSWGVFNPAVAFGPQVFDLILGGKSISFLWIYLISWAGGWILAALRYNTINKK